VIDASCFVGTGPLASVDAAGLESMLRREGFDRAAVSPMDGLFRSDPATNSVVLPPFFRLVPIVDPRWPVLPSHVAGHAAVRITPASHGYPAEAAIGLKELCAELGAVLVVQLRIADPRNLPADLDLGGVPDVVPLLRAAPEVPVVVAGARAGELAALLRLPAVHAELSLAEEPDVLRRAVAAHGADRLLVGTHAPFLTPAAARLKVSAADLPASDLVAVTRGNATRLGL
jgi:hypothetical protein